MVEFNSNTVKVPAGKASDYESSRSGSVSTYRVSETGNPIAIESGFGGMNSDFAQAIYGDGPYSLVYPNNRNDIRAQILDFPA